MLIPLFPLIAAALLSNPGTPASPDTKATLFVSPLGDDTWSGTLAHANQNHTDGPLATLSRARELLRKARPTPGETLAVYLRQGTYLLGASLVLTAEDSGSALSPRVWRSYPGERAILAGCREVDSLRPLSDEGLLRRLPPEARQRVRIIDLRALGIADAGRFRPRGAPGIELFFDGRRLPLARWPNSGWERIADVPQNGDSLMHPGLDRERRFNNVPVGRHYGRISYDGDRPSRWSPSNDVIMHGFWTWDWSDAFQKVARIDTLRREIVLAPPYHHYGYTKNQRYAFLNVLEELDRPGEWVLDRGTGTIALWPPALPPRGHLQVSVLDSPLVVLSGTAHVSLQGITFSVSRGNGVVIRGGRENNIVGCEFTALGDDAVVIEGGTGHSVISCEMHHLALGGVKLRGGDRLTLAPSGDAVWNTYIHHYSEWLLTGQYAVVLDGVGHHMAHCAVHDAPFEAVYLRGNDHLVEFNDIHDVMKESGDAGALHTGRDWTWRGNVIRYNYFHDLHGPGLHGVMAVYLDDFASGFTVLGNIFYRSGRSAFIGGGRDNTIENNIFVECAPSVHIDARGLSWASYYMDNRHPELFTLMDAVHYDRPPYSTRYPELLSLYKDEPAVPKHNRVLRNISFGGRWLDVYDYPAFDFSVVTMQENVIGDQNLWRRRMRGQTGWDPYYLNIDTQEGFELLPNNPTTQAALPGNLFVRGNPGLRDPARGDFRLLPGSPARRFGFRPIPCEKIGMIDDGLLPSPAPRSFPTSFSE